MRKSINQVTKYLDSCFNFKNIEEWDKSGLTFGEKRKKVGAIVVALDLTNEVFELAMRKKADLIVLHHPFIFVDEKTDIINAPYKKEILHRIKNTNIGILVMHTCYDRSNSGMKDALKKALKAEVINKGKYGALFKFEPLNLGKISSLLEKELNSPIMSHNINGKRTYQKIAIIPGAGSIEDILYYHDRGADLIITSDIKWSTWITADELKINIAQVTHAIEKVFINHIIKKINNKFKEIEVFSI